MRIPLDARPAYVYQVRIDKRNTIKRRDIIAKLEAAGLVLKEGGNHTKVYRDGVYVSAVGRHSEIAETIVRQIEKQTGVKLT